MRKTVVILAMMATGCTTATPHGNCIGLNQDENLKLKYEYSAWNIGMGIVFMSLIVPPIVVVLDGLKCPVAARN